MLKNAHQIPLRPITHLRLSVFPSWEMMTINDRQRAMIPEPQPSAMPLEEILAVAVERSVL
jgi:hypothetical protein